MTTCHCDKNKGDLVMTRDHFHDSLRRHRELARQQALQAVIEMLHKNAQMWFAQSLTAGSSAFWQNKVKTTNELIKEIEELK